MVGYQVLKLPVFFETDTITGSKSTEEIRRSNKVSTNLYLGYEYGFKFKEIYKIK